MKGLSRKNFSLAGRRLIYFSAASHSTLPKQFNYHYHSWLPSLILAEGIQVSLSEQPNHSTLPKLDKLISTPLIDRFFALFGLPLDSR